MQTVRELLNLSDAELDMTAEEFYKSRHPTAQINFIRQYWWKVTTALNGANDDPDIGHGEYGGRSEEDAWEIAAMFEIENGVGMG